MRNNPKSTSQLLFFIFTITFSYFIIFTIITNHNILSTTAQPSAIHSFQPLNSTFKWINNTLLSFRVKFDSTTNTTIDTLPFFQYNSTTNTNQSTNTTSKGQFTFNIDGYFTSSTNIYYYISLPSFATSECNVETGARCNVANIYPGTVFTLTTSDNIAVPNHGTHTITTSHSMDTNLSVAFVPYTTRYLNRLPTFFYIDVIVPLNNFELFTLNLDIINFSIEYTLPVDPTNINGDIYYFWAQNTYTDIFINNPNPPIYFTHQLQSIISIIALSDTVGTVQFDLDLNKNAQKVLQPEIITMKIESLWWLQLPKYGVGPGRCITEPKSLPTSQTTDTKLTSTSSPFLTQSDDGTITVEQAITKKGQFNWGSRFTINCGSTMSFTGPSRFYLSTPTSHFVIATDDPPRSNWPLAPIAKTFVNYIDGDGDELVYNDENGTHDQNNNNVKINTNNSINQLNSEIINRHHNDHFTSQQVSELSPIDLYIFSILTTNFSQPLLSLSLTSSENEQAKYIEFTRRYDGGRPSLYGTKKSGGVKLPPLLGIWLGIGFGVPIFIAAIGITLCVTLCCRQCCCCCKKGKDSTSNSNTNNNTTTNVPLSPLQSPLQPPQHQQQTHFNQQPTSTYQQHPSPTPQSPQQYQTSNQQPSQVQPHNDYQPTAPNNDVIDKNDDLPPAYNEY